MTETPREHDATQRRTFLRTAGAAALAAGGLATGMAAADQEPAARSQVSAQSDVPQFVNDIAILGDSEAVVNRQINAYDKGGGTYDIVVKATLENLDYYEKSYWMAIGAADKDPKYFDWEREKLQPKERRPVTLYSTITLNEQSVVNAYVGSGGESKTIDSTGLLRINI